MCARRQIVLSVCVAVDSLCESLAKAYAGMDWVPLWMSTDGRMVGWYPATVNVQFNACCVRYISSSL